MEDKVGTFVRIDDRVTKIEGEVSDMKTRLAIAENNIKDIKEDISTIKDDTRWTRRTITGSLISVVITVIISAFKMGLI